MPFRGYRLGREEAERDGGGRDNGSRDRRIGGSGMIGWWGLDVFWEGIGFFREWTLDVVRRKIGKPLGAPPLQAREGLEQEVKKMQS